MRYWFVGTALSAILLFLLNSVVQADQKGLDYPHNSSTSTGCDSCHNFVNGPQHSWDTMDLATDDLDDTRYNNMCWSCHDNINQRFFATHSNQTEDAVNKYGKKWSIECRTCHWPHHQKQTRTYGADSYLVTGSTSYAGTNYIRSSAALVDRSNNAVAENALVGNILIPNNTKLSYQYKIVSNTNDTITVHTDFDAGITTIGNTFAVIYGKLIKSTITTPNSGVKQVKFFRPTGANSFADGDSNYNGICEVCHTKTAHFRNDGGAGVQDFDQNHTNLGGKQQSNCLSVCHPHSTGMKHGGSGGSGNGSNCSSAAGCHQDQESHPAHVALSEVTCLTCHQQDNFPTFKDDGTSQSNTTVCASCHTNGTGSVVTPPVWGSSPAKCSPCHAVVPTTGSHTKHLVSTGFNKPVCGDCHDATVQGATAPALHRNNKIDVYDVSAGDLGYPQGKTIGTAYTTCSAAYCHSSGQSANGASATPVYATPTWGGTAVCGSCHKTTTGTQLGQIDTGSHSKHLAQSWITCDTCHTTAGNGASYNSTTHVNRQINVGNGVLTINYSMAGAPGNGYGTCSIASCHGTGTPQWGGASLNCETCHMSINDNDDYTFNNGTLASIKSTEWPSSGHGKTSGTYDVSGNPAANLPGAAGSASSCLYCHKSDVAHGVESNPFRLANNNVLGNGWNDNCLICHGTAASGYDPDGAGAMSLKTATVKIDKKHYGAAHSSLNDGGSLCWDCHDPHGDRLSGSGNIYMIHSAVVSDKADIYGKPATTAATVFTGHSNGSDYAKTAAPYNGICQVCHGIKDVNDIKFWRADGSNATHNADLSCKGCHAHSSGFQAGCNGCHGNPPVIDATRVFYPALTGSATAGAHNKHLNSSISTNITCNNCHTGTQMYVEADGYTLHSAYGDGIQIGISTPGYAQGYSTLYDGQAAVDTANGGAGYQGTNHTALTTGGSMVCSNVYCHSNGKSIRLGCQTSIPSTSPAWNWDGVNTAGDPQGDSVQCNNCHGFQKNIANTITSRKHKNHVGTYNYPCYFCHADTAAAGALPNEVVVSSTGKAYHINGVTDIKAGGVLVVTGTPVAFTYDKTTRSCTNVACHLNDTWRLGVSETETTCPDPDVCATGENGTPVKNKDPLIIPMASHPSPTDMFIYANDPNTLHYVIRAYDPDANDPIAAQCRGGGHAGQDAFIRTLAGNQCSTFAYLNLQNNTPSALELTCRFSDAKLAASQNRCFTYALADNDPASYDLLVQNGWDPPNGPVEEVTNDGLAEPTPLWNCINPTETPVNIIDDPYNNIKVELVGDTVADKVNARVVGKTVSLTFTAKDADQVDPVKQAYWQAKYPTRTGGHSADSQHYVKINWGNEGLTEEAQSPTNPAALQLTAAGGTKTYYFNFDNVEGEKATDIGSNDGAAVTTRTGSKPPGTAKGNAGVWIQAYVCDNHVLGAENNMLKDCADTSWFYAAFPATDPNAPTVTAFTVTTPSNTLNIPVTAFTATDDVAVTGYQVTTSGAPPSAGSGGWSGTAPTTYTVGSDGTYTLYPWVKDADANVSTMFGAARTVVVDTTPPSAPGGPTGATVTANSIALTWTASTDSGSGLADYKIERAPDNSGSPGSYSQIDTSVSNSYPDSGLSANTTYWYRVMAYDNAGNNGGYSTNVSLRTLANNPTGAVATDGTYTDKIRVAWASGGVQSGYRVYRDGDSGSGTQVYDGTATSFDDMIAGSHTYYVYSKNADGVLSSGYSSDPGNTFANVSYSVGQNTTDHKTGNPTVTVSGTRATFSVAQTATNMGVGDLVTYTGGSCYISSKTSQTVWNCVSATGETPPAATNATVSSIAHAFASLSAAVTGASDANHLNTTNLVTGNYVLNIPCYYDTGADMTAVTVSGYTTGASNFIRIYTPTNQNTEVNQNQRHGGQWAANKFTVQRTSEWVPGIAISNAYVRIEGIQVYANSPHSDGISYTGSGEFQASSNIIKGGSGNAYRVFATFNAANGAVVKLWNNIAYDMGRFVYNEYNNTATHILYNNTIVNTSGVDIQNSSSMTVFMKNNLVQGATANYTIGGPVVMTTANNISQDGTSPDSSYRNKTVSFIDSTNFHISEADTFARAAGVDLSSDPNFAFNTDIDGQGRPYGSGWDIGADQTGLVGFWSFDDADVNMDTHIAYDRSGKANYGTIYNAAQTTGKIGQALDFNGTNRYIAVTENSSLPIYNQNTYSISMWVKGPANQVDKRIFSEGNNTNLNPVLNLGTAFNGASGKLDAFIRNDSGTTLLAHIQSVNTVFDGTWHHIVWTDNNGTVTLYVDGVADGTNFNYTHSALTLNRTSIGSMLRAGAEYFFNGSIDEVRVYRRVLSLQDVQDLYQAAGM